MKKDLENILSEQKVPKEVKERLIKAAKMQLLMKDMGGLFGINVLKSSFDIVDTIFTQNKNKKKL